MTDLLEFSSDCPQWIFNFYRAIHDWELLVLCGVPYLVKFGGEGHMAAHKLQHCGR